MIWIDIFQSFRGQISRENNLIHSKIEVREPKPNFLGRESG